MFEITSFSNSVILKILSFLYYPKVLISVFVVVFPVESFIMLCANSFAYVYPTNLPSIILCLSLFVQLYLYFLSRSSQSLSFFLCSQFPFNSRQKVISGTQPCVILRSTPLPLSCGQYYKMLCNSKVLF